MLKVMWLVLITKSSLFQRIEEKKLDSLGNAFYSFSPTN